MEKPSRRRGKTKLANPSLVPVMDAMFTLIFFLLMSSNFLKINEISSNIPFVSNDEKIQDQNLGLTIQVNTNDIQILTGVPSQAYKSIPRGADGKYDLELLRAELIKLKKLHPKEITALLEPVADVTYEELVNIMDNVRETQNTDDTIYLKDEKGMDIQTNQLFSNIVFTNIRS
jgi:biopolymer transport protein ExbD